MREEAVAEMTSESVLEVLSLDRSAETEDGSSEPGGVKTRPSDRRSPGREYNEQNGAIGGEVPRVGNETEEALRAKSAFQNLERPMRCQCEANGILGRFASFRLCAPQLQTPERAF